jgi:hypothetical protein
MRLLSSARADTPENVPCGPADLPAILTRQTKVIVPVTTAWQVSPIAQGIRFGWDTLRSWRLLYK